MSRAARPRDLRSPEDVLPADILGERLFDGVVEIEESDCEGSVAVVVCLCAHDLAAQDERTRAERHEARRQGELEGQGAARLEADGGAEEESALADVLGVEGDETFAAATTPRDARLEPDARVAAAFVELGCASSFHPLSLTRALRGRHDGSRGGRGHVAARDHSLTVRARRAYDFASFPEDPGGTVSGTGGERIPTAAIVVIGDEILSGKTEDTNTPFLLRELRALGVSVRRITVVPDVEAEIAAELRRVQPLVDYVFTSGGVGPTHDDVTIVAIAAAMERRIVRSPEIVAAMNALWQPVKESHLRMADVPEGSELVYGGGLRFPLLRLENIFIFPGVPEIFREKFLALKERFRAAPFHLTRVYTTYGEGHLTPLMNEIVASFPEVAVGSYPTVSRSEYRVMVTFESKNESAVTEAVRRFLALVGEPGVWRVE